MLTGKLLRAGKPISALVYAIEDPVQRREALERIRGQDIDCAAPWSEVLNRLGLQLSPCKARELVAAFRALPRHLSEEMDEAKVRVHTRIRFARLLAGRAEAAEGIWAAVKTRKQPQLLTAAVRVGLAAPDATADEVLDQAEVVRERANEARSVKLSRDDAGLPPELVQARTEAADPPNRTGPGGPEESVDFPDADVQRSDQRVSAVTNTSEVVEASVGPGNDEPGASASPLPEPQHSQDDLDSSPKDRVFEVDGSEAVEALRGLVSKLRAGQVLDRYVAGSLRLLLDELRFLLDGEAGV